MGNGKNNISVRIAVDFLYLVVKFIFAVLLGKKGLDGGVKLQLEDARREKKGDRSENAQRDQRPFDNKADIGIHDVPVFPFQERISYQNIG